MHCSEEWGKGRGSGIWRQKSGWPCTVREAACRAREEQKKHLLDKEPHAGAWVGARMGWEPAWALGGPGNGPCPENWLVRPGSSDTVWKESVQHLPRATPHRDTSKGHWHQRHDGSVALHWGWGKPVGSERPQLGDSGLYQWGPGENAEEKWVSWKKWEILPRNGRHTL